MDLGVLPAMNVPKKPEGELQFLSTGEHLSSPHTMQAHAEPEDEEEEEEEEQQCVHPRFAFHINGCSSRVYVGIRTADDNLYKGLVQRQQIQFDHPRPQMIPALLDMKLCPHLGSYRGWYRGDQLGEGGMTKEAEAPGTRRTRRRQQNLQCLVIAETRLKLF
ncbi:hypothetical protein BDP27DRAFT_429450 [Rhodocollybia butyracea]|uniref:Uncharacterized protein n=1 Tax=Rhodocollybia butyracea TaxID=206335 RepID=A0A9P5PAI9_9AGAR|nr:hypothetical protein BDP27DRAFT_429450 [Rhodocollybia butyracea]